MNDDRSVDARRSHREKAIAFLQAAASGQVRDAYQRYVHRDFRHHNPYFPGDRDSLQRAMEEAAVASPNKSIEVKRVLEDGDLVAVHSRVRRADPSAPDIAVVHILRFQDGLIIEEWEAGNEVPKDSPNQNGAF
jgi:predicted SnoaL-like aldol condensation-catalyzing enzyme